MIDFIFVIFVFISYICLALTTSAILNTDVGNKFSKAELIIYKNKYFHLLSTFALVYTLTKSLIIACFISLLYIIIKYVPFKHLNKQQKHKEEE